MVSKVTVGTVVDFLDQQFPVSLAESWDNTGLLAGRRTGPVQRVMTCLTITPPVVEEAVRREVSLLVAHHPLPFRPVRSLSEENYTGGMLWDLASAGVAIYSPHTRFDSAEKGINQQLGERLRLRDLEPLETIIEPGAEAAALGAGTGRGRWGHCVAGTNLADLVQVLKEQLGCQAVKWIPAGSILSQEDVVRSVAIGCGSAGEFLQDAHRSGCDLFITGEASFHTCLEAQALGVAMVLVGHYHSERFALEWLADYLTQHFPEQEVWASIAEKSPIRLL